MEPMSDFRIDVDFFDHPKTKRLQDILGSDAVLALIQLWRFAAKYRPKGELTNMDDEAIAIAANWKGRPGDFVDALCLEGVNFLDEVSDNRYAIHDWEDWNPFAFMKPERSAQAKKAAKKRWQKAEEKATEQKKTKAKPQKSTIRTKDLADAPSPNPIPSPKPSPSPKPEQTKFQAEVLELFHECCPSLKKVLSLTKMRRERINGRMKDGLKALEHWRAFFERVEKSDWLTARHSDNKTWTPTLDWIIDRDKYIEIKEGKYDNKKKHGRQAAGGSHSTTTGKTSI